MLEKGLEQILSTMLRYERISDFWRQVVDVMQDEVGHLAVFGVPPGVIDDIELGRVSREKLNVNPLPIDILQQTGGLFVATEAVPDHQQRPLEVPTQLLNEDKDIVSGDVPRDEGEVEAQTLFQR